MKNAEFQLRADLTDRLQNTLSGLNEKHARKLQKHVGRAVKKLAKTFSRSFAKEVRATEKKHLHATRTSVKELVGKLHQLLSRS